MEKKMTNGTNILTYLKESKMAISVTEDMGFCSGEDYFESEIHSPTDTSEDSLEVKITPIQSLNKKRKFSGIQNTEFTGPLKKRMCMKVKAEESQPFRPWSPPPQTLSFKDATKDINTSDVLKTINNIKIEPKLPLNNNIQIYQNASYFRVPSPIKPEPVPLIKKREEPLNIVKCDKIKQEMPPRVPIHPSVTNMSSYETEQVIQRSNEVFPALHQNKKAESRREQRNYKNMTRERRIEANARERTRVHTISAAFDTLRKSIPSYSHNQKLSKLSVLRIACSYISTLASIVAEDKVSTLEYVDLVSKTIQKEGKLRKKKDDDD